jgi:hypothetical protein
MAHIDVTLHNPVGGDNADVYTAGPERLAQAKALHQKYPLLDGHNDLPWALHVHNDRAVSSD